MNKIIRALGLTIVSSIAFHTFAIAQFDETFDDGDILQNPEWTGKTSDFAVQSGTLRLQAPPDAGRSYLATPSRAIRNATWEFSVALAFNPSDANYARVCLVSDQNDITKAFQGYFVQIGSRSDEVSLWRQDLSGAVRIIDGADGVTDLSDVSIRIKVTRDAEGVWALFTDAGLTGNFVSEGTSVDLQYSRSSAFGILCNFTSSRAGAFRFDDITVRGEPGIDAQTEVSYRGVMITEILADPSPSRGLPEVEFVEIYNAAAENILLEGWTLSDGTSTGRIPAIVAHPGEYLVLAEDGVVDRFDPSVPVAGVAGMPSLNNSGDAIVLRSALGAVIDSINFSISWYGDGAKAEGGWTLELIDPANLCGEENNWAPTESVSGGTPGQQNSVFGSKPDQTGPVITGIVATDPFHLSISFDEKLADEPVLSQDIVFDPPLAVGEVSFSDHSLRTLDVAMEDAIASSTLYRVTVRRVRDCSMNQIADEAGSTMFALPEEPDSLDVVVNEILFNPGPGGADFVELFNRSPKYINLRDWGVGGYAKPGIADPKPIASGDWLLEPGGYALLTTDRGALMDAYPRIPSACVQEVNLPSLPDDGGSVAITDPAGNIIDAVNYSAEWHSPFLVDDDGVSLERVSYDAGSLASQNWTSASAASGYASPCLQNSNVRSVAVPNGSPVAIDPPVFHPGTGQPAFTLIRYNFDQSGFVANARVLDAHGRTVKLIANNDLLGTEGFYTWEGDCDDGSRARVGYYWLWLEVFDPSGAVKTYRERIVVAGDF